MGFSPPRVPSAGDGAYPNGPVLVWTNIEGQVKVLACLDAYANTISRVGVQNLLVTDQLIFRQELSRMATVIFGCSVRDVTEDLKVRPGGLLPSLIDPLLRSLPKEETSNVGILRLW